MEEAVYYRESDGSIYLRATGHVTSRVCPDLKTRLFARLDSGIPVAGLYIDLGSCEYMDSTFLGLIVGAQKRFGGISSGPGAFRRMVLVGPNEACVGLLRTIGVLGMLDIVAEGPAFPELERITEGMKTSARFILDAHEELSDLSEENRARFAALTSVLKASIGTDKDGRAGS